MIKTANNKVLKMQGRVFMGAEPLVFTGTSTTFPFSTINNAGTGTTNSGLTLTFNSPSIVTVDYGNGVVKRLPTIVGGLFNNAVIISNNYANGAPYTDAIYTYSDGLNIERKVRISYNRANLIGFEFASGGWGIPIQPFSFRWASHPVLQRFNMTGLWVTTIDVTGISRTTNPFLTQVGLSFFAPGSEFSGKIPENILEMPIQVLRIGSNGYNNTTLSMAQMNIDKIATYTTKTTLKTLILQQPTGWVDAQGLPVNFEYLEGLEEIQFSGAGYSVLPPILNKVKTLKTISYNNCYSTLESLDGIGGLINLEAFLFQYSPRVAATSLFPVSWNNFTKLRTLSYYSAYTNQAAYTDAYVNQVYDLITRNNTPKTGVNNGTIPLRGMTINVQMLNGSTVFTGTVEAPPGYVAGSSNGTPTTTGHKIFLLRNQYGHTVLVSA